MTGPCGRLIKLVVTRAPLALLLGLGLASSACGGGGGGVASSGPAPAPRAAPDGGGASRPFIFVIAMENHSSAGIYGSASAPYINGVLLPQYAHAADFEDELPGVPSEPHYVWMEAGTNSFADSTFTTDDAPSAENSTASTAHLATQIRDAAGGVDWMAYQEGIGDATGACPIHAAGTYTPQHNPFVFFQDVAGAPPAADNAYCAVHHRPLDALAGDLSSRAVKAYNFVTPDVCHDMHGGAGCSDDTVRAGDDWLSGAMPALISFVNDNGGVVLIVWDEHGTLPFLAVGPDVKTGYAGSVRYDHGSLLRSVEEMLGLPVLPAAASKADVGDLFVGGALPGR
jgi:hypothetical protein